MLTILLHGTVGKQRHGVGCNLNQGQVKLPPNVMKFKQQVGDTYTYTQSMSFCCHQFLSMDLYTFPITSEPEVRPLQLRSQNLSLTNLKVPLGNIMALKTAPWP